MTRGLDTITRRLARECERGASSLSDLQDRLSDQVDGADADALLREMQALDTVQQTLADIAIILADLAVVARLDPRVEPDSILHGVRQSTLKARLRGEAVERPGPAIELF